MGVWQLVVHLCACVCVCTLFSQRCLLAERIVGLYIINTMQYVHYLDVLNGNVQTLVNR